VAAAKPGLRSKFAGERALAVRGHLAKGHARVVAELLRVLARDADPVVSEACLAVLTLQKAAAAKVVPAVTKWLDAEAEAASARRKKNDPGFPLDPRTGEPEVDTLEGRAAMALLEARGRACHQAVRCVRALASEPPSNPLAWTVLLEDAHDPLVAELLGALAAWKCVAALRAILDLFRCYPTEASYETGAVVDPAGTDASAKRTWMVKFGHPDKRRPRPDVTRAIDRALLALTGEALTSPEALAARLDRPAARRRPQ
jgi:hypothetical protein